MTGDFDRKPHLISRHRTTQSPTMTHRDQRPRTSHVYGARLPDVTRYGSLEGRSALERAVLEQSIEPPISLLDWLFPYPCWSCGREPVTDSLGLCSRCRPRVRTCPRPACTQCARPISAAAMPQLRMCAACVVEPRPFARLVTVWDYRPPIESVMTAFKFRRQSFLARPLARAAWDLRAELLAGHDFVVPVPLHWIRRLRRGFNQAEALASELTPWIETPTLLALARTRGGVQSRTPFEERARNVRRAFAVRPRHETRLHKKNILLIDDVTTTGATLAAATRVLLRAGASSVTAFALLRTPDPREPSLP